MAEPDITETDADATAEAFEAFSEAINDLTAVFSDITDIVERAIEAVAQGQHPGLTRAQLLTITTHLTDHTNATRAFTTALQPLTQGTTT